MGRYTGKSCRLTFMLTTAVVFFSAEIMAGYVGNSIALVSDSFNMLADIISLSVGLTATRVRRRNASKRCTYGLARVEVVGALSNAVFLSALCFSISVQALERLIRPEPIDKPVLVLVVGSVGLGINIMGLLIFQDCRWIRGRCRREAFQDTEQKNDVKSHVNETADFQQGVDSQDVDLSEDEGQPLNIKGVLLHLLNDALGSFVVVVAAVVFYVWPVAPDSPCTWQCYVDPSLTLLMVAIIMSSAAPLIKETASILLHITPASLPFPQICEYREMCPLVPKSLVKCNYFFPFLFCFFAVENVCRLPGVLGIHDAHAWLLTKGRTVATLHIRVTKELHCSLTELEVLHTRVREVFHKAGIHSVTVQLEFGDGGLKTSHCSAPCLSPNCMKISCCPAGIPALTFCKANLPFYPSEMNTNMHDMKSIIIEQEAIQVVTYPQSTMF